MQERINLNGIWKMCRKDGAPLGLGEKLKENVTECKVTVPGSVVSGLLDNGLIQDPYFADNEYEVRDMLKDDFVFTRKVNIDKKQGVIYELMCDGIDTVADIYLNGILLRKVSNMHTRYQISCSEVIKDGENEIRIDFHSPIRYVQEHKPQPGKEIHYVASGAMKDNQYLRKAHSMYGWDWGIQLPDMGIWRDIYIRSYETASLENVRIHQFHEDGKVRLKFEAEIKDDKTAEIKLYENKGMPQDICVSYEITDPAGNVTEVENDEITIDAPQLWWPAGFGEQPLYKVRAVLKVKDKYANEKSLKIGLRTLKVSMEKDQWGQEFAFCVNGVKIFIKGGNYIPEDAIYSRITKERIQYLTDSAKDAGFNCLRIWGGGYYPSDEFYDICDSKGLIIWQDFMFACNIYELTDEFKVSITDEIRDNIKRLRHHASLGMWCGNNEIESAWDHWGGFSDHSDALKQDYFEMFEKLIPQILKEEDGVTTYWPSSPSSGGGMKEPDSDNIGDRHYWDVWHGEKPFTDYENHFFRFCSEFGFQSFPSLETIETFTEKEDRNIFSEVMESHQKNDNANEKMLSYISQSFLYPKDFESLIYVSQVLQGQAIKYGVEHWRRNRGRCMGTIYWQLNDNWPVASWASIDYYGRWKALHYMARHFYADILGSLKMEGYKVIPYVQDETFKADHTEYTVYLKNMDCDILFEKSGVIETSSLSVSKADATDLTEYVKGKESNVFVEAVFTHSDGNISHQVEVFKPYKHMKLKKSDIKYNVQRSGDELIITLKADKAAFFTEIQVHGVIMVLSDNFIHLTDNKEHVITGKLPEGYEAIPEVTVRSLCDSYEY